MGTLLDLASLVVVPSGYKEDIIYSVKPTDGSGDLDFTRALDTATRVGPDGLIEKVRTNLVLRSQEFDNAAWDKIGLTLTGSQTDPNGGTNAFLATATATSSSYFYQTTSTASCVSVFAKAGTRSNFSIINGLFANGAEFNLATQTTIVSGAGSLAKIESVGGGWFRCSVFLSSLTDAIIALDEVFGGGVTIGQTMSFAFAQQETGDIATPYIPTTTAAVSVGMLANVPRLDYTGGGCPKLLLEPQRTNLVTFSEQIDNAAWDKSNATIAANVATSPAGFLDADKLQEDSSTDSHFFGNDTASATSGQVVTFSIFLKAAERSFAALRLYTGSSSVFGYYNLANGTLGTIGGGGTGTIVSYGNGWYRCSLTITMTSSSVTLPYVFTSTGNEVNIYTGTTGYGIFCFGCQQELGSYATSYIPTLGAAVTRSADAASKTGISALIGQTEGTLYVEINIDKLVNLGGTGPNGLEVTDASNTNVITIGTGYDANQSFLLGFRNAGTFTTLASTTNNAIGTYKLAGAYSSAGFVFFLNGVQIGTGATLPPVATFANLQLVSVFGINNPQGELVKQALLFPTRLTNTQLIELTTP